MKMRSTGVRVNGVRHLLASAKNLQGVRCSTYDVLQVWKKKYLWKKNHKKQNPTLIAEATSIYTKKNHKKTKTSGICPNKYK